MPTVLLVRHGRTTANATGVLAGWTPGIGLDETGQAQVTTLAGRLAAVPLARIVASPLQRCQETVAALVGDRPADGPLAVPETLTDDRFGECRYGDWTGRPLNELVKEPLWRVVQAHPSAVTFPGPEGESMLQMQTRAVTAIREHDAAVAAEAGDDAVWMAVSHGDVIKSVLADALGMPFDSFQRLMVDTASVSVVRYTTLRPFAVRLNDSGADLGSVVPVPRSTKEKAEDKAQQESDDASDDTSDDASDDDRGSDAVVGGSLGTGARS